MKKFLLFALLCLMTSWGFAQTNTFPASGNVGVGTLAPATDVHIKKTVVGPVIFRVENDAVASNSHSLFIMKNGGGGDLRMQWVANGVGTWYMGLDNSDAAKVKFAWDNPNLNNAALTMTTDGLVGIRTENPASPLSVNGKIDSEEVEVMVDVPDFVFEEEYDLFSLPRLENFIKENKHLPNVQSVSDAANNRGGYVRLGEFSAGILENLETTILHVIEMNKTIERLEKENEQLSTNVADQLKALTERMNLLEAENAALKTELRKK